MKWFYNLSKQAQIAICFITAAVSILWIAIFAVMEQLILTIIGIVIFAVAIFFIYCYSRAEKNRRTEQAAANPKTKDPVINEYDSTETIIRLARERASEIIQKGDMAVQARIRELETLIMPEAEREKLNHPSDIPALQRQVALIYEQEALLQYLADSNK